MPDDDLEVIEGEVLSDSLPVPMELESASAVLGLRLAIAHMDSQLSELEAAGDIDSVLIGYAALNMIRRDLTTLAQRAERIGAELMFAAKTKAVTIPHVGTFERKRKTDRKAWDTKGLATALVADALERGAIDHPLDVVELMLACGHVDYWRVEQIGARGFQVDEWCETTKGGPAIKFTGETR
jgi:hypothetical protein